MLFFAWVCVLKSHLLVALAGTDCQYEPRKIRPFNFFFILLNLKPSVKILKSVLNNMEHKRIQLKITHSPNISLPDLQEFQAPCYSTFCNKNQESYTPHQYVVKIFQLCQRSYYMSIRGKIRPQVFNKNIFPLALIIDLLVIIWLVLM